MPSRDQIPSCDKTSIKRRPCHTRGDTGRFGRRSPDERCRPTQRSCVTDLAGTQTDATKTTANAAPGTAPHTAEKVSTRYKKDALVAPLRPSIGDETRTNGQCGHRAHTAANKMNTRTTNTGIRAKKQWTTTLTNVDASPYHNSREGEGGHVEDGPLTI